MSLTSGIQYLESRIRRMESRIQDYLGLPFTERVVVGDFFNLASIIDVLQIMYTTYLNYK